MFRIARDRNDSLNRRAELERETAMAFAVVVFIGTPFSGCSSTSCT
ncbi:hypothetical protein ACVWWH_003709 [Sinomonas sp. RB5]